MATPERTSEADAARATPAPKRAQWGLALRIASGLVFVPLLILLARAGGLAWLGFVALQTGLGLEEFYRMARAKGLAPVRWLGFASALALLGLAYRPHTPNASLLTTGALLVLLALALRRGGLYVGLVLGMTTSLSAPGAGHFPASQFNAGGPKCHKD